MSFFGIPKFYPYSLRWKLITGVAVIHAVLMSLFIGDLVIRQKKVLLERQQEHAHALSQTLAVTCAHWLISYDIAGLQELINAQKIYPELSFALITDINNKILAHTESDKIGQRVVDMPNDAQKETTRINSQVVDVVVPVNLAETHIGWVRLGIGNHASEKKLKQIVSAGTLYALGAVFVGALISWFLGTKLTSRLYTIQKAVRQIKAGEHFARIELAGNDEPALMAREFNRMFARLQHHEQELKKLNEDLERLVEERTEELKISLESIKMKNEELEAIFAISPHGIAVVDLKACFLYANRAYLDMLQCRMEELLQLNCIDLSLEEEREKERKIFAELPHKQIITDFEKRLQTQNGETVIASMSLALMPDKQRILLSAKNITTDVILREDLLRKNIELTETKEELEKARQLANLGVWEFDLTNDRLNWSDEIYKMFELDRQTFTPSYEAFLKIVHPDDRDNVRTTYANSLRTREKYKMTHRIVTGRGRIKWVEEQSRAEFDDHGRLLMSLGTVYDITMQKEAEETLKEANLAKSVFLSNMSHELRTPLNAILGYAQIFAEDRTLSEKQQSGIKTIRNAGEHLLMLINDLLDLSKIEAGKLELFPHEIVFKKFLQGLCDIAQNRCIQKKISFCYEPDNHLPDVVVADELRLRQILLNLLSNAAKFTDTGYCLLQVKAKSLDGEKTRLTFIVEDSGPGIAQDQQKEIFEPFKQSGEHLKHSEGTGLGLSISLQLATLMDGTLSLISPVHGDDVAEYGPGSRFIFSTVVPRRDIEASEKFSQLDEPDVVYSLQGFEAGSKTILIVDDQPSNRAVLKDILEPLGFVTIEAEDGKDVLAACERQRPDLIFMDLIMPGFDGFTAIKQLHKMDQYARIPVVAITASLINQASLREKCQKIGFSDFLPKPFAIQQLLKTIAGLLNLALHRKSVSAPVDEAIVAPPFVILEQLQNHLEDGNIEAIESMALDIAKMDSMRYHAFARRLGQLAADIQLKKIEQLLDQLSRHS